MKINFKHLAITTVIGGSFGSLAYTIVVSLTNDHTLGMIASGFTGFVIGFSLAEIMPSFE